MFRPHRYEKRPDSMKLFERKNTVFSYIVTIFALAARRGLFGGRAFFDDSEISSEFVGGQCASWRLPPKAAVSAYRRHSFVEGIRNGGLDVLKTAAVPGKSIMGAQSCLPCNGFFLSPSGGAG